MTYPVAAARELLIPAWLYLPAIGLGLSIMAVRSWHTHVERVRAWKRAQARLAQPVQQGGHVRMIDGEGPA